MYEYHIFPRDYNCAPYNFSALDYKIHFNKYGLSGVDSAPYSTATQFQLSFPINITDDGVDKTTAPLRYLYIQFEHFRINVTLSRDASEVRLDSALVPLEFKSCLDGDIVKHLFYTTTEIKIRPEMVNCYPNVKTYVTFPAFGTQNRKEVLLALVQSQYFEPIYAFDSLAKVTQDLISGLELYEKAFND